MHKSKVKYLKVKNSNHETNQRRIQGGVLGLTAPPSLWIREIIIIHICLSMSEIRELQKSIKTYNMRAIFHSMFYCVQVLYTTNQYTSVFRDI